MENEKSGIFKTFSPFVLSSETNYKNIFVSSACKNGYQKMIYWLFIFLWPLINYLTSNFEKISDYSDVGILASILFFLSLSSWFVIKKYFKQHIDVFFLPLIIMTALFFGYGVIVDTFGIYISFIGIKATHIWLVFVVVLSCFSWKISKSVEIQKITKIMILVMMGVSSFNLASSYWNQETYSNHALKQNHMDFVFKHKPNVYYILLDAYGRQDTLKETADFDNEPFLKKLESLGFSVSRKAYSNYHFTGASLSATMNMSYHNNDENGFIPYGQMHESLKGYNPVRKIFRNNHYKIINVPAHWHQITCYGNEDMCIRKKSFEVYQSFFSQTPFRVLKFNNAYVDFNTIKETSYLFDKDPKFVFAHIAQIHDAVFDESGNFHSILNPAFSGISDSVRYVASIKKVNDYLLDFIKDIKLHDKNAIIILQADHGPTYVGNLNPSSPSYWLDHTEDLRLVNKEDYRYTFGIFSAIYVPEINNDYHLIKDYFSGQFTLINTFRYIFAYLSDQKPDLLADESHFIYYDKTVNSYKEANIDQFKN